MDHETRRILGQHGSVIEKLAAAAAEQHQRQLVAEAARIQKESEAAQRKAVDALSEIQGKMIDRAAAYANLMMIGGYAGIFTIWSSTRAALPIKASISIASAITFSLVIFISFEIYKMILTAVRALRNRKILTEAVPIQEFLERLEKLKQEEARRPVGYMRMWMTALVLCISSALVALGLLGYNFAAVLLNLPMWPK